MKTVPYFKILICILIIGNISCVTDDMNKSTDPAAIASYTISNRTSETLIYSADNNIEIPPSETKEIDLEAVLGGTAPMKPATKFDSIVLLKSVNGSTVKVLEIKPVINEEWTEKIISYNNSNFILSITNDRLDQ
jgi:hypothetical protein